MSGLAAIHARDGRPVDRRSIARMLARLRHRGPCGQELWCDGPVGLGVCSSAAGRGASIASARLAASTTIAIALDGRIDNRRDLAPLLRVDVARARLGDAELALRAYEAWDERFLERLVGEFALVLWDGRRRRLLVARDAFGTRTLYHHVAPGILGVASEARALLALDGPFTLDDERIADYLVPPLEARDRTSTFYREIRRVPAAHRLGSGANGITLERYWSPADAPALQATPEEGVEAFREVFAEAVRCRIDGSAGAGVMLSGGVDSTAIAAFGARARLDRGAAPLPTFSAVLGDGSCPETRAIEALLAEPGYEPARIGLDDLPALELPLGELLGRLDEPFDATMIVPLLVYLLARRSGLAAVLDGVDGDAVASLEPDFLGLVLRRGDVRSAWREAGALAAFYDGSYGPWSTRGRLLARAARYAWTPEFGRRVWRRAIERRRVARVLSGTILDPDLARRARIGERLIALWHAVGSPRPTNPQEYHASQIDHPFLAVAVERYDRVAAVASIEARHPFLDRRVVELAVALPWGCKVRDGWTKWIVREACQGLVPDAVRWRRGRWQRLGPRFLEDLVRRSAGAVERSLDDGRERLAPYVDRAKLDLARERFRASSDPAAGEQIWAAAQLAEWLRRQTESTVDEESGMSEPKDGATETKKPYRAPKLTEYGELKDLTAGGSGSANEGSSGQRPRP